MFFSFSAFQWDQFWCDDYISWRDLCEFKDDVRYEITSSRKDNVE